ncbi:hypothetical protein D9M68_382200 [compost metagenome]
MHAAFGFPVAVQHGQPVKFCLRQGIFRNGLQRDVGVGILVQNRTQPVMDVGDMNEDSVGIASTRHPLDIGAGFGGDALAGQPEIGRCLSCVFQPPNDHGVGVEVGI